MQYVCLLSVEEYNYTAVMYIKLLNTLIQNKKSKRECPQDNVSQLFFYEGIPKTYFHIQKLGKFTGKKIKRYDLVYGHYSVITTFLPKIPATFRGSNLINIYTINLCVCWYIINISRGIISLYLNIFIYLFHDSLRNS
jgi:hypothetical protein